MSSDAADYTVYSMAISEFTKLFENFLWIGRLLPFVLLGVVGFPFQAQPYCIEPHRRGKKQIIDAGIEMIVAAQRRYQNRRLKKAGYLFCILPVFYWLRNQDLFNVN